MNSKRGNNNYSYFAFADNRPKQNNDSSDDDEPLSKIRAQSEPPVIQQKRQSDEATLLANYVANRDNELKKMRKIDASERSSGTPRGNSTADVEAPNELGKEKDSEEKMAMLEHLQAEKKKREVLCAEKVIAETKCKTLQQRLDTEGKELWLMRDKITSLETDKRELTEALESAKNATAAIQAMHERVWKFFVMIIWMY